MLETFNSLKETINSVVFIVLFIIPGFISLRTIGFFIPRNKSDNAQDSTKIVLDAISFSCVNYALFGWWLILLIFKSSSGLAILEFFLLILIFPCGIGLVFAKIIDSGGLLRLTNKVLKLNGINLIPKAWD